MCSDFVTPSLSTDERFPAFQLSVSGCALSLDPSLLAFTKLVSLKSYHAPFGRELHLEEAGSPEAASGGIAGALFMSLGSQALLPLKPEQELNIMCKSMVSCLSHRSSSVYTLWLSTLSYPQVCSPVVSHCHTQPPPPHLHVVPMCLSPHLLPRPKTA